MRVRPDQRHKTVAVQVGGQVIEHVQHIAESRVAFRTYPFEILSRFVRHGRCDYGVLAGTGFIQEDAAKVGVCTMRLAPRWPQSDIAVDVLRIKRKHCAAPEFAARTFNRREIEIFKMLCKGAVLHIAEDGQLKAVCTAQGANAQQLLPYIPCKPGGVTRARADHRRGTRSCVDTQSRPARAQRSAAH